MKSNTIRLLIISIILLGILLPLIFVLGPSIFFPEQESKLPTEDGDKGDKGIDSTTPEPPVENVAISGFNFNLETGTYWHYYWTYEKSSGAQGSGSSSGTYTGNFIVTLGEATEIDGVMAYTIETSGDTADPDFEYTPRWTHLAVYENQILGSDDNGASLKIIFDARTGVWQGGGFFLEVPDDLHVQATKAIVDNEFTAYLVDMSKSEGEVIMIQ